ncbi:hypothetical protein QBC45DRAFT_289129, partial [Copromyces sp. CBS 386.78]
QTGYDDNYFRHELHARSEETTGSLLYLSNHATHRQPERRKEKKRQRKGNNIDIDRYMRFGLWYEFLKLRIAVDGSQFRGNAWSDIK